MEIADGRRGVFDFKPYLDRGVFRELRDVNSFNQVGILFGAVTWPHEQDIAPETLLAEMQVIEPLKQHASMRNIFIVNAATAYFQHHNTLPEQA